METSLQLQKMKSASAEFEFVEDKTSKAALNRCVLISSSKRIPPAIFSGDNEGEKGRVPNLLAPRNLQKHRKCYSWQQEETYIFMSVDMGGNQGNGYLIGDFAIYLKSLLLLHY